MKKLADIHKDDAIRAPDSPSPKPGWLLLCPATLSSHINPATHPDSVGQGQVCALHTGSRLGPTTLWGPQFHDLY